VIFTTFATALEDFKRGDSPLSKIHWYRIVLDEGRSVPTFDDMFIDRPRAAHKIRNRKTKQFQAVQQLLAQRRWCLTGTPIQNRLEDLGSLIAFLRVPELERASTFRTCIITPTSPERGSQFQNLQTLLKTICLRRTREILGMPEPIAHPRPLVFSAQERQQYNDLYEHYRKHVQMAVSGVLKVASTTLQSIHELRLFCNNGPKRMQNDVRESDDEVLSYLQQLDQNICAKCSMPIFCIDQAGDRNGGAFISPCKHLVCHSCWPQCLDKKKACVLCAAGNVPPDLSNHIDTSATLAPEETALQYPTKLLTLLHDIRSEPGHKW
jgi:SWI/SNF-related matrix-associated actin-dependent regulator of chromatin subfamily A3